MGRSPLEREALWYRLRKLNTPLVPQAVSLIDIALWDMAARHAGLPLYQLLGGARDKVLAYASTPLLADADAYIRYVAERLEEGFRAIKFHCWCEPSRDLPMLRGGARRFRRPGHRVHARRRAALRSRSGGQGTPPAWRAWG